MNENSKIVISYAFICNCYVSKFGTSLKFIQQLLVITFNIVLVFWY